MNDYTFYREADGFIESNVPHFVDTYCAISQARELAIGHGHRMSLYGYNNTSPPPYPYLKAVSAHSAAVQLYARSGQLATMDLLYSRGKAADNLCPFKCGAIGNAHHLFVHCTMYTEWRSLAEVELMAEMKKKLKGLLAEEDCMSFERSLLKLVESMFSADSSDWPLHKNFYYLGRHPELTKIISESSISSTILRRRVIAQVSSDWHSKCIRLAGRIFGDYQKRMAVIP